MRTVDDRGGEGTRDADLVFRRPDGQPVHASWLLKDCRALCRDAGVPVLTPHGLRHAAVTMLRHLGVDPTVVQQLAGHATLTVTDGYTGVMELAMRDASNRLGDALPRSSRG